MSQTVSVSVGRVAIDHDIRETISDNVDPSLIHQNEIFIDKLKDFNYDVVAYTNAKFQTDIDEHNLKQKRADRKINTTYVEYLEAKNQKLIERAAKNKAEGICKSVRKPTPLVHEYVLQFGNRETNGTLETDIEMNRRALKRVVKAIQHDYPHVDILLCTFHADEPNGTPHAHLLVQFTGEGYTRGLKHEISMNKALECDGIERSNTRGEYSITKWVETLCDDYMEPVLEEEFGEEREYINDSREHLPTPIFRQKAREEAEFIQKQKADLSADKYVVQKSQREFLGEKEKWKKEVLETETALIQKQYDMESIAIMQANKQEELDAKENQLDAKEKDIIQQRLELSETDTAKLNRAYAVAKGIKFPDGSSVLDEINRQEDIHHQNMMLLLQSPKIREKSKSNDYDFDI